MPVSKQFIAGGAAAGPQGPASNMALASYKVGSYKVGQVLPGDSVGAVRRVGSRVDYLTFTVKTDVPYDRLVFLRALLDDNDGEPVESLFEFAGEPLVASVPSGRTPVALHASHWFDWRLLAVAGDVEAQVTVYSEPFWRYSVEDVLTMVQAWVDEFYGEEVLLQPSRVDLCADVVGWSLPAVSEVTGFLDQLVRRTRDVDVRSTVRGGVYDVETLYIGAASGAARLTVYDKSAEVKRSGKDYYFPVWRASGWTDDERVTRFEYRVSRRLLREFHGPDNRCIAVLDDLRWALPLLWEYLTSDYCRHIEQVGTDSNRWRAPLSVLWSVVARPFGDGVAVGGGDYSRWSRRVLDRDRIEAQALGCLVTRLGLTPGGEVVSLDELGRGVAVMMARMCERVGVSLGDLVEARRARLYAA